jgi:hypothetical protein
MLDKLLLAVIITALMGAIMEIRTHQSLLPFHPQASSPSTRRIAIQP